MHFGIKCLLSHVSLTQHQDLLSCKTTHFFVKSTDLNDEVTSINVILAFSANNLNMESEK